VLPRGRAGNGRPDPLAACDAESLSPEDLQGLLTAALNGGRQGFDAVLRTRKGGERKSVSIPWGSKDDD
jgi:hypothetical protein